MASLSFEIPPRSSGEGYAQKSFTSSDLSSGTALVPALADCTAVIDYLYFSCTAAETWSLKAGSDFLVDTLDIAAGTPVVLDGGNQGNGVVRSDTINEAITLTVSAGQVAGFVKYHYERQKTFR